MVKNDSPSFGLEDCEIIDKQSLYKGMMQLMCYKIRHRLYQGGWSESFTREVVMRCSAAAILPYDPILDRIILIEQFRPGSLIKSKTSWLLEIPAGLIMGEKTPEKTARAEAMEEAGCHIHELELIADFFVSPGASDEYLHLYCGRVDASSIGGFHGLKHEHEDICVFNVTAEEAFDKLRSGKIKTTPAIISLLWLQLNRERLRAEWK